MAAASVDAAQKRILPSRNRRGGPGIGSCDVDVMILGALRSKVNAQSIIPASTTFLLTTDSSLVPSLDESDAADAIDLALYFDRPEVIRNYQREALIQTPDFKVVTPEERVTGRLRVRGSVEDLADTSDEAYLRRHRKYETFEKRQRRREKEKLVHEQFKLRERLEQLRGMEPAAFLPPSGGTVQEAETARREMLEAAEALEMRYNMLLPPDPRRVATRRGQPGAGVDPDSPMDDAPPPPPAPPHEPVKLKIRLPAAKPPAISLPGIHAPPARVLPPTERAGAEIPEPATAVVPEPVPHAGRADPVADPVPEAVVTPAATTLKRRFESAMPGSAPPSAKKFKRARTLVPSTATSGTLARRLAPAAPGSDAGTPDAAYVPSESGSSYVSSARPRTPLPHRARGALFISARRNSMMSRVRHTTRTNLAFGVLPPDIKPDEFRLPEWVRERGADPPDGPVWRREGTGSGVPPSERPQTITLLLEFNDDEDGK